jgi:CspA family cold shock protein
MFVGQVLWFDYRKGFGFIEFKNRSIIDAIFVHYKEIHKYGFRKLNEHELVTFQIKYSTKGRYASNVNIINNNLDYLLQNIKDNCKECKREFLRTTSSNFCSKNCFNKNKETEINIQHIGMPLYNLLL